MTRLTLDTQAEMTYLHFTATDVAHIDWDRDGNIVGIELWGLTQVEDITSTDLEHRGPVYGPDFIGPRQVVDLGIMDLED